jgi:hypothetical protein
MTIIQLFVNTGPSWTSDDRSGNAIWEVSLPGTYFTHGESSYQVRLWHWACLHAHDRGGVQEGE